jgi:hypothetical protein
MERIEQSYECNLGRQVDVLQLSSKKERPHLLDFNASHDKWQDVHSWLIQSRRVSNKSGGIP